MRFVSNYIYFNRENNQTTTKTYISDIHDIIIVEYVSEKGDC